MRKVDTAEYVSVLRELTEQGKEVTVRISGDSMAPFMYHDRDFINFKKPDRELRKGDMVFYQRDCGQYVMHRVFKVTPEGYYVIGDAQSEIEGPVRRDQIFGLITKIQRKGRWIGPDNFWWKFFAKVWIRIVPLRRTIMSIYRRLHR